MIALDLFGIDSTVEGTERRGARSDAGERTNYTRPDGVILTVRYVPGHVCNALCMYATGKQCDCSCGGRNHGMSNLALADNDTANQLEA